MRALTLIFSFVLFLFATTTVYAEMASVNGDAVNLRSGPGKKYAIKWEYGDGFPLKVLRKSGNWVKVSDFENDIGWIYKPLLSNQPHMIVKVLKNTNKTINIRRGPGTNYDVVGEAYYGVVFQTLEQKRGWAKVRHASGLEGWIKRSLLWGF